MFKLAAMLYVIVSTVTMGAFAAVAIAVEPLANGPAILAAAVLGALAALPLSWRAARAIHRP